MPFMSIFVVGHQRIILTRVLPIDDKTVAVRASLFHWFSNIFHKGHFCPCSTKRTKIRFISFAFKKNVRNVVTVHTSFCLLAHTNYRIQQAQWWARKHCATINSLALGKSEWNIRYVIHCNIQTDFSDWLLRHHLWNCSNMNVTRLHWWVNIGSGNGLVPSGNKPLPEPMLTQISVAIWCL